MKTQTIHEPYTVSFETVPLHQTTEHAHTFFELVYIRSGKGTHRMNQDVCPYQPGNLFLLTPEDQHFFIVEENSAFFFLRFNPLLVKHGRWGKEHGRRLAYVLANVNHQPGCVLKNVPDRSLVAPVVEAIFEESTVQDLYSQELVDQLVSTLLVIVARNVARFLPELTGITTEEKVLGILTYIQDHIYEPQKLTADQISRVFAVSEAYLGRYVKKHIQETMQTYITRYKLRLIEHRLRFSPDRMTEIAATFGFTDVSHLNKFFKKQHGVNLEAYRKREQALTL